MAAGSGTRMGAARPKQFLELRGKAILQRTIEVFLEACPGISVVTVLPATDTIKGLRKEGDELQTVEGASADRSVLYGAQTPQIFHSECLKSAYSEAYDVSFTDDASVVQKYGKSLSYVIGERLNIKITTREDLLLAEAVMSLMDKS